MMQTGGYFFYSSLKSSEIIATDPPSPELCCHLFSPVEIAFMVSLKSSSSLFCLLIDPHDSPPRWLLRWSHPWSSSGWRPLRDGGRACDQFLPFSKCDVKKSLSWIGSRLREECVWTDLSDGVCRQGRNAVRELSRTSESRVDSESISYIDLFMWIWKISTFSPDLAVTWGFCPNDLSLVHQSACFMNVLQWTVFVSLLEKKNCPRTWKSKQRPGPAELVCSQFDMTSMYTKVLTEGDETKCSTKCWWKNMSHDSVVCGIIMSSVTIYHPEETLFACEKPQWGFAWLDSNIST